MCRLLLSSNRFDFAAKALYAMQRKKKRGIRGEKKKGEEEKVHWRFHRPGMRTHSKNGARGGKGTPGKGKGGRKFEQCLALSLVLTLYVSFEFNEKGAGEVGLKGGKKKREERKISHLLPSSTRCVCCTCSAVACASFLGKKGGGKGGWGAQNRKGGGGGGRGKAGVVLASPPSCSIWLRAVCERRKGGRSQKGKKRKGSSSAHLFRREGIAGREEEGEGGEKDLSRLATLFRFPGHRTLDRRWGGGEEGWERGKEEGP